MDATVYLDANGEVTVIPDDVDAVMDDCGVVSLEVVPSAFNCTHVGPNIIILTATDNDGNTATCTATESIAIPSEQRTQDMSFNIRLIFCLPTTRGFVGWN